MFETFYVKYRKNFALCDKIKIKIRNPLYTHIGNKKDNHITGFLDISLNVGHIQVSLTSPQINGYQNLSVHLSMRAFVD